MCGNPTARVAKDGQAYGHAAFIDFYGPEYGELMWQSAQEGPAETSHAEDVEADPSATCGERDAPPCSRPQPGECTGECTRETEVLPDVDLEVAPGALRVARDGMCGTPTARIAKDGRAYGYAAFIEFYGQELGEYMWEIAPEGSLAEERAAENKDADPREMRVSRDGKVYSRVHFVGYHGQEFGEILWDFALPVDLVAAAEKYVAVVEAFENLSYRQGRMEEAIEAQVVAPASLALPWSPSFFRHFDFVEVGTSDWGTLLQYCAGQREFASCLAEEIRTSVGCLRCARGLSVEAVPELLRALPELPRVRKVEAAMGEHSGEATVYLVSPENAEWYMGKYTACFDVDEDDPEWTVDVMYYAKSLASVGKPHPNLVTMLTRIGRLDLLEERPVRVLSWADLAIQHGISSVDVVQLDCEGMDCAILRGMLAHGKEFPEGLPRLIQFEANHLTDETEVTATLAALAAQGYKVRSRSEFNVIVER